MNAFEKVFDMLVTVAILFLMPLLFYDGGSRVLCSVSAGEACENFFKRVSTSGEITLPVWKELQESLERFGCDAFEIQREYALWEPGEVQGSVVEQRYSIGQEELWEQIQTEGRVSLHKGDKLRMIVYVNNIPTVYYDIIRSEGKTE